MVSNKRKTNKTFQFIGIDPESDFTLDDLLHDYMNVPHKPLCRKSCKDDSEYTCYEDLRRHLSSLNTTLDFICGEPNPGWLPDTTKYIYNGHQWFLRMKKYSGLTNDMETKLKSVNVSDCKSFEDFRKKVKGKRETGFGNTCIYDFSLRYLFKNDQSLLPKDYVYIHATPFESALCLLKMGVIESPVKGLNKISINEFTPTFTSHGLTAMDIEHFMCVYYDYLVILANRPASKILL